jgi:diacylglycerol kinase family enzyme
MTAFAVFNPASDGGRTGRRWRHIEGALESIFPTMDTAATFGPGQAAHLVRDALREGHLNIIAVGGDGVINEALNGFFDHGLVVSPDAVFNFVNTSEDQNGSDIAGGLGVASGAAASVAHLRQARVHKVDVGKVSCLSRDGRAVTRYFLDEASFGLTGSIARALGRARLARLCGRGFARRLNVWAQALLWHDCRVRLMAPDLIGQGANSYDEIAGIASVVLANGRLFGGGLPVAPNASPRDGLLDVTVMAGGSMGHVLRDLAAIRRQTHLTRPGFRTLRTKRLTAVPTVDTDSPVDVETDGEVAGVLPATFEILPGAINLRL